MVHYAALQSQGVGFAAPSAPSGLTGEGLWARRDHLAFCNPHFGFRQMLGPSSLDLVSNRRGFCKGGLRMAADDDSFSSRPKVGLTMDLGSRVRKFNRNSGQQAIMTPDFRLPLSVLGFGLYLLKSQCEGWGFMWTIIGAFLTLQTARLRFRFSRYSVDVVKVKGLTESGKTENDDTAGTQRGGGTAMGPWDYSSIVNWEFWWPGFPILAYFKETQTRSTGQKHFFPVIMDGKEVYSQMLANFGPSRNPKPKLDEWDDLRPLTPKGFARCKAICTAKLREIDAKYRIRARVKAFYRLVREAKWSELQTMAKNAWVVVLGYLVQLQKQAQEMFAKYSGKSPKAP